VLVGGSAGSGKTQTLRTLVALLAASNHPHDLTFLLLDASAGRLAGDLRDLPHVTDCLTGFEQPGRRAGLMTSLVARLAAEMQWRRTVMQGQDIATHRATASGSGQRPFPRLAIVADELDGILGQDRESETLRVRLAEIAQDGGRLGVHLLLATSEPAGLVDAETRHYIDVRIGLRLDSAANSRAVLGSEIAFGTVAREQVGRGYVRAGIASPEPFQVGHADAPCGNAEPAEASVGIVAVGLDGTRAPLAGSQSAPGADQTQLAALGRHLKATAEAEGIGRRPPHLLP
jgi:S-DNA-T family DNA segregation ATPase FtsK/SpoIIIE